MYTHNKIAGLECSVGFKIWISVCSIFTLYNNQDKIMKQVPGSCQVWGAMFQCCYTK